jgi:hypothetical protein
MERADIYILAKNRRTSVKVIGKYYAAHLKDAMDGQRDQCQEGEASEKEVAEIRKGELATLR